MLNRADRHQRDRHQVLLSRLDPPTVSRHPPINVPPRLQSILRKDERHPLAVHLHNTQREVHLNLLAANIPLERCILLDLLRITLLPEYRLLRPAQDTGREMVEDPLALHLLMSIRNTLWSRSISCSTPLWIRCSSNGTSNRKSVAQTILSRLKKPNFEEYPVCESNSNVRLTGCSDPRSDLCRNHLQAREPEVESSTVLQPVEALLHRVRLLFPDQRVPVNESETARRRGASPSSQNDQVVHRGRSEKDKRSMRIFKRTTHVLSFTRNVHCTSLSSSHL
jgi:hypothetical protein